jgi:hypothetical protein
MIKLSPILVFMAAVVSFALPASALASPWRGGDHSYGYGQHHERWRSWRADEPERTSGLLIAERQEPAINGRSLKPFAMAAYG